MDTTKSLEEQFNIFLKLANDVCLNTKLHATIPMYFEDLGTQSAWFCFTRAYWMGVKDADKGRYL